MKFAFMFRGDEGEKRYPVYPSLLSFSPPQLGVDAIIAGGGEGWNGLSHAILGLWQRQLLDWKACL